MKLFPLSKDFTSAHPPCSETPPGVLARGHATRTSTVRVPCVFSPVVLTCAVHSLSLYRVQFGARNSSMSVQLFHSYHPSRHSVRQFPLLSQIRVSWHQP